MVKCYLINGMVEFYPDSYRLISLSDKEKSVLLHAPASRCLLLLIQNPTSVISQSIFLDEVWTKRGAHVSANTFYQNISILRKGLQSSGLGDEIIKTVSRKGLTLSSSTVITPLPENHVLDEHDRVTTENQLITHSVPPTTNTQEMPLAESIVAKKERKIKLHNIISLRSCALMALTALIIVTLWFFLAKKDHFADYTFTKELDGCLFYMNENINQQRFDALLKLTNYNSDKCQNHRYVYLTTHKLSSRASLIYCDKDMDSYGLKHCNSELLVRDYDK